MNGIKQISTKGMERAEWLELRRHTIGGSDAAAIVGLDDYSSPYTIWADKTGRLPDRPDNEAMRQGRDLEAYVASRWTEASGRKVRRVNAIIYNDKYPYAHADIDRWVIGENAGLECKATSIMNLKSFRGGEYPARYYVQCVHYMAVTGADHWYLAVLVLNQGFYEFTIERDEAEINALMEAEASFWQYVQEDKPIPLDGLKSTSDALEAVYPGIADTDEVIPLFRSDIIRNYLELNEQIKLLEQQKEKCEQILKQDLGDCHRGECGSYSVERKPQTRSSFDVKAFQKDNPEICLDRYYKTINFRRFSVKKLKERT